jgi:hypothetical protein
MNRNHFRKPENPRTFHSLIPRPENFQGSSPRWHFVVVIELPQGMQPGAAIPLPIGTPIWVQGGPKLRHAAQSFADAFNAAMTMEGGNKLAIVVPSHESRYAEIGGGA